MSRSLLLAAAREFNSGRFFEAHEVLEEGLEVAADEDWGLILGLIQIAVGYHKASQRQWSSALQMLAKGRQKLAPYGLVAATLRLQDLRARVQADMARIRERGGLDLDADPPRLRFVTAEPRRRRSSP